MNCPIISIFPKLCVWAPTDILSVICSFSGVDVEVVYLVYMGDKFADRFSCYWLVVMEVDPRSVWVYVPNTPIVELGESDSLSLVVGDKPVMKSYWKGFGFFLGRVEFCGVFVIDLFPLVHTKAIE